MGKKESDLKYHEKNPMVHIRLSQETKDKIPTPKSPWIREAILERLGSDSRDTNEENETQTQKHRDTNSNSRDTEFKKYLIFFFKFFQKNASNIEISELEREQIKNIYGVIKSE